MRIASLEELAREHVAVAHQANAGRSAVTVHGGRDHHLRQTLIALTAGTRLGEHESPGEATLQVLDGQVTLHAGSAAYDMHRGELGVIPPERHDLEAITDAVVLLTVATRA